MWVLLLLLLFFCCPIDVQFHSMQRIGATENNRIRINSCTQEGTWGGIAMQNLGIQRKGEARRQVNETLNEKVEWEHLEDQA